MTVILIGFTLAACQTATTLAYDHMLVARRTAEQAKADRYAPGLLTSAQTKARDGQAALDRSDFDGARSLFRGAQADYQNAAQEAARVAQAAAAERQRAAIEALIRGKISLGVSISLGGSTLRATDASGASGTILGLQAAAALPPVERVERVERYPTVESPAEVAVGVEFAVQVSLTEALRTPDVTVQPGTVAGARITSKGALSLPLLTHPGQESWPIDVIVSANGFAFPRGGNVSKIVLPRHGDSTPAIFHLRATSIQEASQHRELNVTLWHNGVYFGRVARAITVLESPSTIAQAAIRAPSPERSRPASLEPDRSAPDLTVFILEATDGLAPASVIITSPHLQPSVSSFDVPQGLRSWIDAQYDRFVAETASASTPDRTVPLFRGFGRELYQRVAPPSFKAAFWRLHDRLGPKFQSIQIYSNNPIVPWELMRPSRPDGSHERDFLGIEFRIARWHVSESSRQLDRAPQAVSLRELVVVAPRYGASHVLPSQQAEMRALRAMKGFREMPGRLSTVTSLFGAFPEGIIHFAGHGSVKTTATGIPEYAILLEDSELDVLAFRGLVSAKSVHHPFVFFNACTIGQARRVANFVDGWAPAALEAGASGYLGGLWLLGDSGAAQFAVHFYRAFALLQAGPVEVAEVLRHVRRLFYDSGDPTFLAYVYYGDPHFRFVAPGAATTPFPSPTLQ